MSKTKQKPMVMRAKGATHKEEMQRRKERRDVEHRAVAPISKEMMEGKTRYLKTGKYTPAGRFKNVRI